MPGDILWKIIGRAWMGLGIVWLAAAFTTKRSIKRQPAAGRVVQILMMVASYFLLFGNPDLFRPLALRIEPASRPLETLGCVVTLLGIAIALAARFFLGRNWSGTPTVKQNHELIRTGPYSFVRHPIYFGLLLAILGTALYLGELRGFLSLILAATAWKWKSLTEEQFMREQFGSQYDDYRRHVKGIIPYVW